MPDKNTSYNKQQMDVLAGEISRIKSEYTKIINDLDREIVELHTYWNDDATGGQVYQTFKSTFDKIKPALEEGTQYIQRFETSVDTQRERYAAAENKIISNF